MLWLNGRKSFVPHLYYLTYIIIHGHNVSCTGNMVIKKSSYSNRRPIRSKPIEIYKMKTDLTFSDEQVSNVRKYNAKNRTKRSNWSNLFLGMWGICMNYPLCCDIDGKDTCSFFCPVCPIKRDFCKYVLYICFPAVHPFLL